MHNQIPIYLGKVHTKIKMLSLFVRSHVIQNLFATLSPVEPKRRCFEECLGGFLSIQVFGCQCYLVTNVQNIFLRVNYPFKSDAENTITGLCLDCVIQKIQCGIMGNGSLYSLHLCVSTIVYAYMCIFSSFPLLFSGRSHPRDAHFSFVELDQTHVIFPKRLRHAAEG